MSISHQPSTPAEIITRHSRSFRWASLLFPARVRQDVEKLYAWCRTCDDAVDLAPDTRQASNTLEMLEGDVFRISKGEEPFHPASRYLAGLLNRNDGLPGIEAVHAMELLEGMRMDLDKVDIQTEAELLKYCYHAAGVVGLMMCRIMGTTHPAAHSHAVSLGLAMQLTNIARDVLEDQQRGRNYLPGVQHKLASSNREVALAVMRILELADAHYTKAKLGISYLPVNCRIAILLAMAFYREIGQEIRRRNYNVFAGRTIVPRWRFAYVAATTIYDYLRSALASKISTVFFPQSNNSNRKSVMSKSVNEARHAVFLGLSLTSFMAAALFMLVYINPKEANYSYLPLVYAACSVFFGIVNNRLAVWCERTSVTPATAPKQ